MSNVPFIYGLSFPTKLVTPQSSNFSPPTWPPHPDWVIIYDTKNQPISKWGDYVWHFDLFYGKRMSLNFGDNPNENCAPLISKANANLLRILTSWWMYGPRALSGVKGVKGRFDLFRSFFVFCTTNNIVGSDINLRPELLARLAAHMDGSRISVFLNLLTELYTQKELIGFELLNLRNIRYLKSHVSQHSVCQTPYMPPRIWEYQINRLQECLVDFEKNEKSIIECFTFWADAYNHNSIASTNKKIHLSERILRFTSKGLTHNSGMDQNKSES